jgi:hypothetical protein
MSSSYQVVLWKQESFVVLRPLQIEFFRNLLGDFATVVIESRFESPGLMQPAEGRVAHALFRVRQER